MSDKEIISLKTFKSCCLVCLQQKVPLTDLSLDMLSVLELIVDAKFTDQRLPNKACEDCTRELNSCSKFIEKCKYSYSALLAALEEKNDQIDYHSDVGNVSNHESDCEERNDKIKAEEATVYMQNESDKKDTNLECAHCKEIFLFKDQWMEHLKTHSFPGYQCTICGRNFKYPNTLAKHKRIHRRNPSSKAEEATVYMKNESDKEDANLECAHCQEIFSSKDQWMEHLKTHSFPGYECTICGQNFKYPDTLAKHERIHRHKPGSKEQTKTSPKNRKSLKHLYTKIKDNGKLKLQCTLCDRILTTHSAASSHMLTHTGEKPFSCEFCGKKYSSRSSVNIHIRQHTGETPYKCRVCNKGFRSTSSRKKHETVHHFIVKDDDSDTDKTKIAKNDIDDDVDPDADKVECEICKKKIHKHGYGVHRKSHLSEKKQFICTYCNKEFQKNSHLQRHLRIHTGERPYTCKICKKSYVQDGDLKRHMNRIHKGTEQFQCQHCGKFYYTKTGLESHVLTHLKKQNITHATKRQQYASREKRFLCMICGKGFTANSSLKEHMMSHTGETPHKCLICGKGYTNKTCLKQHTMRQHTGEKPYRCLICNKRFYESKGLKKHMNRVHSVVDIVKTDDEIIVEQKTAV